jgi:molybdopterin/thiamine biosynthesis adenylyltransferase/rhodanese-related sulfurtransferase
MNIENPSYDRYKRQIILKEFGESGQQKLLQSKVLVIGAGGLGCPALQYLAAAGVGTIGIVDDDVVSLTNLHRQILYSTLDIGFSKAEKAKHSLTRLNPDIYIIAYNERLTTKNATDILGAYDIVIDGTDNFATRYLLNDACVLLKKPLVYGAVSQFEGQVAVFNYPNEKGDTPVNYRDLFPNPPKEDEVLNCVEAGVLGVLPGIIGTMQANETIKLITGIGKALINSLFTYNALNNQVYEISLVANEASQLLIPATKAEFEQMDYNWLCASPNLRFEIDGARFGQIMNTGTSVIIDVREVNESPKPTGFNYTQIPLSKFRNEILSIKGDPVIIFCQTGKRSLQAAQMLFDTFGEAKTIYSLKGGILNWVTNSLTQQK